MAFLLNLSTNIGSEMMAVSAFLAQQDSVLEILKTKKGNLSGT